METTKEINDAIFDIQQNTTLSYRAPEMADPYAGNMIYHKADVWVCRLSIVEVLI